MTDIGVFSQPFQAEDRSWLLSEFEDAYCPGLTLDISKFTQATHYANGFIPSGTVLGLVTATGLYGPYDDTAADGRQTATGILVGSVRAINPLGGALAKVGGAQVVYNAVVSVARLPFNSTNAATGRGYIDAAGQTDLKFLYFAA
jgi:hypothetical protein